MNRKLFTILTALMWIAHPLTALRYSQIWEAAAGAHGHALRGRRPSERMDAA